MTETFDYARMLRARRIPPHEPRFILRAQDQLAVDAVRYWAEAALAAGAPVAVVEQALQEADRMADWPIRKLPGADHIGDPKALESAFVQRGWNTNAQGARKALDLARGAGRHDGFEAGKRSLDGPLGRLRDEIAQLRSELTRSIDMVTEARAQRDAARAEADLLRAELAAAREGALADA